MMRTLYLFLYPLIFLFHFNNLSISSESAPTSDTPWRPQRIFAPIEHKKMFQGERELYGYNPAFIPNVVTFDPDNNPYIRIGVQKEGYSPDNETRQGYIQTLSRKNGQWLHLDFVSFIKKRYPHWNGLFYSGTFAEERIAFDSTGDAYMVVNCGRPPSNLGFPLLLHSKDQCKSWDVYELPRGEMRLEINSGHHLTKNSFFFLVFYEGDLHNGLFLILPIKKSNGRLPIPAPQKIAEGKNCMPSPSHSGLGNNTITKGNLVHIVYLNLLESSGVKGTAQYVITFNKKSHTLSKPYLLGINGHDKPDVHNGPAITIDSHGFLHAILGGHQDQLYYTRSLEPNSSTQGWTKPVPIGKPVNPQNLGGYTYISLVCDPDDTLHLVSRYAGDRYLFCLDYLRKTIHGSWEDRGHLVIPFRTYYSCWYHKLTIDNSGHLFLYYIYYGNQYGDKNNHRSDSSGDEIAAYRTRWNDNIVLQPGSRKQHGWWNGIKAHSPAILTSDDHGEHWYLLRSSYFKDFF